MLCTDLILFFDILLSRHDKASSNRFGIFSKSGDCGMSGKLSVI